jgi:Fic family protein
MYIHELENWPHFLWDEESIIPLIIEVRHEQGVLMGSMKSMGFPVRNETLIQVITEDVIKTSEIEGEILDLQAVRSSVARHLGFDDKETPIDPSAEGVVAMMLDATQNFDLPLTKKRLFYWHTLLFPIGVKRYQKLRIGMWRLGAVDVVLGPIGKEKIHFEAPHADRVNNEIDLFLDWFNRDTSIDLVLKAAIAHLWFVTIHPFEDGNGRIGRALADLLLSRSEKSPTRFYSLSGQIHIERKGYYSLLEQTQKGSLDITLWIEWFLQCVKNAITQAITTLEMILVKGKFWENHVDILVNERQRKIINLMLDGFEGKLTSSKWAKITKCSQDSAYRDILDLIEKRILIKNPEGGRNTSYFLNLDFSR